MTVLVAATTGPYKVASGEELEWLRNAEQMIVESEKAGINLKFFAALETDARGKSLYTRFFSRVEELKKVMNVSFDHYWFSLDDQDDVINGANRLVRICTGRNLIHEYAQRDREINHVLFLDTDLVVPPSSVVKLMEMNHPIVGGDVPSYCMSGPGVLKYDYPVQQHWNTAGFLMVNREIIRRNRWRADLEAGSSDDPCFAADVKQIFGYSTYVRKDLIGYHAPLQQLENRGHDLEIKR